MLHMLWRVPVSALESLWYAFECTCVSFGESLVGFGLYLCQLWRVFGISVAEVRFRTASENRIGQNRTVKFGSVQFRFCWFWRKFGSQFWHLGIQPEPVQDRFEPNLCR